MYGYCIGKDLMYILKNIYVFFVCVELGVRDIFMIVDG